MLEIVPITRDEALEFIREHHRHSALPQGYRFACAVSDGQDIVGVATAGRPVARMLDDGFTLEVTRCCTNGTKNAPSKLYAACWRAARALGYRKLITYTRDHEPGTSLRAAGFSVVGQVRGRSWHTPSRPRVDTAPQQDKLRWELQA